MSDEEEHSESEFYYPDVELEFQDNSDLTEKNNERVAERENEGNSQKEAVDIFLYVMTSAFDSVRC